jgi:methylmalonyl-CoA mutase cobalamin-binding subunit
VTRRTLRPGGELIAEGRSAAPTHLGTTKFLQQHNARSERAYKEAQVQKGVVMYHAHIGLSTWTATEEALREVHEGLAEHGHELHRFGLALDRAMGVRTADRANTMKETGPRLNDDEWLRLGEAAPIQPHLGDFMIGFPAGFENTLHALRAGVSTIGNLGQYLAFDLLGGSDEIEVTEETVKALAAVGALRKQGALAHSNLEDGPGMQMSHYGAYVGWAALELYVVEELIGAKLAHCYGNLIASPESRAVVHFALDDIRDRKSIGSMMYGNTVGHVAGNVARNTAVLAQQVMIDVALQLRRPTGHAVNPVPLSEAERIPSAREIVEAHLLAREFEREVRDAPDLYDWNRLEALGAETAKYAREWKTKALGVLDRDGVNTSDPAAMLLAMRQMGAAELETRVALLPSQEVGRLEPWKSRRMREVADALRVGLPRLDRVRIVLVALEVHDLMRDAIAKALPTAGAEVVLLGASSSVQSVVRAGVQEDAAAIVVAVYNGNALDLGRELMRVASKEHYEGIVIFGGLLNQDFGDDLPVDVRPQLTELGIICLERVDQLGPALAAIASE